MAAAIANLDFIVKRDDWRQCRFVPAKIEEELQPGQVRFRVDRFAFTSNNVSYALAGDMLDYWGFFPAQEGWGRIPTMGFGDVIGSRHPDVPEGDRVFGFFPMSTGLVIEADGVTPAQFVDAAPHRQNHAPAYRQYTRVAEDPLYDVAHEDQLMLLRGLFMTSFLVDDFVSDNDLFSARSFVISSASSKTAIALAFLLARRGEGRVIGLTSPRNISFVEGLGFYDEALPYDELKSLPADVPVVFVDHSGDGDVVNGIHHHFGNNLRYSCIVGATHWDSGPRANDLPGAPPTFFFAPTQLQKRIGEWGPTGFQERLGDSWQSFRASSDGWLRVVRGYGKSEVERVYAEVLEGRATPSEGHVLSLHDAPEGT
jgi:NADPH:quinone reductase-like Zn-dependent oxidoreductase